MKRDLCAHLTLLHCELDCVSYGLNATYGLTQVARNPRSSPLSFVPDRHHLRHTSLLSFFSLCNGQQSTQQTNRVACRRPFSTATKHRCSLSLSAGGGCARPRAEPAPVLLRTGLRRGPRQVAPSRRQRNATNQSLGIPTSISFFLGRGRRGSREGCASEAAEKGRFRQMVARVPDRRS